MTQDDRDPRRNEVETAEHAATIAAGSVVPTVAESSVSTSPSGAVVTIRSSHAGRFAIGSEIARGGMGRVVEAEDAVLQRTVAVKVALFDDADLLQRFERETRITAGLEHPSIVPVYDAGRDDAGRPFYVMRRVSGEPLDALVSRATRVEDRLALVPHMLAAAHALAYAHARGIVHRDVKPSNILVGKFGETVVIDWGLAKSAGEPDDPRAPELASSADGVHTRVGAVIGSPGFMSPEQLAGDPVGVRSDVYALGATLYYVLACQAPHTGRTPDAIMTAAIAGPARPIGEVVRGVPRALAAIVDKALAYDRDVRYSDAGTLEADLERFLTGQLVASHRYTAVERVVRFVRRNRFAVVTVVAAAIAIAIIAWVSVDHVVDERDRARDAEQRERLAAATASDRADEELVSRAAAMVATNPTLAVALVKGFTPSSRYWPRVQDIVAAARMLGVAWRLPGPDVVVDVAVSPDGRHGLASGADGDTWLYDLPAHSGKSLGKLPGGPHFLADGRILVVRDASFDMLSPSGASRTIPFAGSLLSLHSTGSTVFWLDRAGLWRVDGAGVPEAVAIHEPVVGMSGHFGGRWMIVATTTHVWVVSADGKQVLPIADGRADEYIWDGDRVVVRFGRTLRWIDPATGQRTEQAQRGTGYLVSANHAVYSIGDDGYTNERTGITEGKVARPWTVNGRKIPPRVAIGRSTLLIPLDHEIDVVDGAMTHHLLPPIGRLGKVSSQPESRYVLAVDDLQVVLWNLDDCMPARTTIPQIAHVASRSGSRAIHVDTKAGAARWIDLDTLAATPAPVLGYANTVTNHAGTITFAMPVGGWNIDANMNATHSIPDAASSHLLGAGTMRFDRVPLVANAATFVDDHRVFVATDKELAIVDANTLAITHVADGHGPATDLAATGDGWLAAGFEDGTLWRRDPSGRVTTTHGVGSNMNGGGAKLAMFPGGRVLFATNERDLAWWAPDGKTETLARVAGPIEYIENVADAHAVVYVTVTLGDAQETDPDLQQDDSHIYYVDVDEPHNLWDGPIDVWELAADDSQDLRLFGYEAANTHEWRVADPEWGFDWSLGRGPAFGPNITPDGKHVWGYDVADTIFVWRIPYPADAAELGSLTNAVAKSEHGRHSLTWSTTQ